MLWQEITFTALWFVLVALLVLNQKRQKRKRLACLRDYEFPAGIKEKLMNKYPSLPEVQLDLIMAGLRDYFHICFTAGRRMVSMPSQAVDDAWHEFILYSREYEAFCRQALGRFLYHTPVDAMPDPAFAQFGIRQAWRLACDREHIDPKKPEKLPLLFAMDSLLNIQDGFIYHLDCAKYLGSENDCASHIECGSGAGCASAGGCGGGGCGGGCGGCGGGGCGG